MKKTFFIIIVLMVVTPSYSQTAQEYFKRGSEKYKLDDYSGAIADHTKAIEIDPNYAAAYFGRGSAKYFLQDFMGSIADLTRSISISPKRPGVHFFRGMAKYSLKDYRGAITDLTEDIDINPTGEAYFYRGISQFILGQKDVGCLDLSKAGELGNAKAYEAIKKYCQ